MLRPRVLMTAAVFLIVFCAWSGIKVRGDSVHPNPDLINTCLITDDVGRLVRFYEAILKVQAQRTGEDYAEFSYRKRRAGDLLSESAGALHSWFCCWGQQPECGS